MLNAVGYVISQAVGRYRGTLRTVSIKAEINILPTTKKLLTAHLTSVWRQKVLRSVRAGQRNGETLNKEYDSLSFAAPEFGPKKLCTNLGIVVGQKVKITTP